MLVGCGRLGSALVEGWLQTGGLDLRDLIILTPPAKPVGRGGGAAGADQSRREALAARDRAAGREAAMWRQAAAESSRIWRPTR